MTVEQPLSCQCELPHGQTSPSVAAELRGEARETERIGGDGADVILTRSSSSIRTRQARRISKARGSDLVAVGPDAELLTHKPLSLEAMSRSAKACVLASSIVSSAHAVPHLHQSREAVLVKLRSRATSKQ